MAYLGTIVPAGQRQGADFSALMHRVTTVGVRLDLLPTLANLGYNLQARGTVARVALNRALMATWVNLFTSVLTSRYRSLTLNGRINFRLTTRAEQRLS